MKVLLLLAALCSSAVFAATPTRLSKFTQEDVQALLTQWRLDKPFAKNFKLLGFDGSALDVLDKNEDLDSNMFPGVSPIYWKILLRKVAEFKHDLLHNSKRRNLAAAKMDTSAFHGVRIKTDNAVVALGQNLDVKLVRTGPRKLTIFSDVEIKGEVKYAGGGGSGDVLVGNSGDACTSATAGAIRWLGPKQGLAVCDGKKLQPLINFDAAWISEGGGLFSALKNGGQGEGFARDDVPYCLNCADPSKLQLSTDFRIGSGDAPFNYYGSCASGTCEIGGDENGNVHLTGSNGNDAIRMKSPLLKGDFEYGCTVSDGGSDHNRFGMGLWGADAIAQFKSANSAGYCAQASSGHCYFCRFESSRCSYRGSYDPIFGLAGIHAENTMFKLVRKGGEICGYTAGVKRGCYKQKYTGDMYGTIQNDGGTSRNLHKCYYKPLVVTGAKGNFPFATIQARNYDKSPITSYTVTKGKLPPGMNLDKKTGMIYGKPSPVPKATKFDFSVRAEGKNDPITRGFAIEVRHRAPVDTVSTDFSIGSGKPWAYSGGCNSKCEIAGDSAGNIKLDGTNGNDAIIMRQPQLVGDFEYGCTVTAGTSTHNRFGMGLWDQSAYGKFKSSNSAGHCAQADRGMCFFCRFEGGGCSYRGSYTKLFELKGIHDNNAQFMLKRVGNEICAYINNKKQGCYKKQTGQALYGAVHNDGGSSRNMHKCYWKTSTGKILYK